MKQIMISPSELLEPTASFDQTHKLGTAEPKTRSEPPCRIYRFEKYQTAEEAPPQNHTAVATLIARATEVDSRRAAVEAGRKWIANELLGDAGDTVKTLRLKKGWSQSMLATLLHTSQSHVARIERGTENLAIDTCRRLANALEIDMNKLDELLKRQQVVAENRANK